VLTRRRLSAWALALGCALAVPAPAATAARPANPCLGPRAPELRCPDLKMKQPFDLFVERTPDGRTRLRAGNSIDNIGLGPAELRGRRNGRYTMKVTQKIHRRGGGKLSVRSPGRLVFKAIPGQDRYWKFFDAARFELREIEADATLGTRVRVGPKVSYCLRDLRRNLDVRRAPSSPFYPACSQDLDEKAVTLGTSKGWSDVYAATYHEQWIDVTGLSGRFAYSHTADPADGIFESDETNNTARTIVTLPFRGGGPVSGPDY